MSKAADKLAELLEEKEQELESLQKEVDDAKDNEIWRWARHEDIHEEQTLPVPRLEMWLNPYESDDYNRLWIYRMIHRHLLGHCVAIPMGCTKQTGGGDMELLHHLPFRDGAHIKHDARAFGWPAFMVRGGEVAAIPLEMAE